MDKVLLLRMPFVRFKPKLNIQVCKIIKHITIKEFMADQNVCNEVNWIICRIAFVSYYHHVSRKIKMITHYCIPVEWQLYVVYI